MQQLCCDAHKANRNNIEVNYKVVFLKAGTQLSVDVMVESGIARHIELGSLIVNNYPTFFIDLDI